MWFTDAGYDTNNRLALAGGDLLVLGKTVLAGTSMNPAVGSSAAGNHTEDGGSIRCATHPLARRLRPGRG